MIEFGPLGATGIDSSPSVLQLQPFEIFGTDVAGLQSVLSLGAVTTNSLLSSSLQLGQFEIYGFSASGNYGVAQLSSFAMVSSGDLPIPVIGVAFLQLGPFTTDALVTAVSYGGSNNVQTRSVSVVGMAFDTGVGYGAIDLERVRLTGGVSFEYTDSFDMAMNFYVALSGGTWYNNLISDVDFASTLTGEYVLVLADALRLNGSANASLVYNIALSETFSARDVLAAVFDVALADSVVLVDLPASSWRIYAALADVLTCTGLASSQLNGLSMVASSLVLRDIIALVHEASINDPLVLSEAAASLFDQLVQILDTVTFADLQSSGLSVTALLSESVEFDDALTSQALFNLLLNEGVTFTSRLRLFGEDYVGYVMNTRTRGVSEYQGYNFNSFAELDGKYYGANDEGLYLLEGDTDDSTLISAHIRTGLTDFGTQFKKQVHDAYIGYTTDGRLLLKVITTDAGERKENWYALNAKDIEASSDNRFRISKGLKSVYWQFEVTNIDGADFDISNMTVWPFVLHRRK